MAPAGSRIARELVSGSRGNKGGKPPPGAKSGIVPRFRAPKQPEAGNPALDDPIEDDEEMEDQSGAGRTIGSIIPLRRPSGEELTRDTKRTKPNEAGMSLRAPARRVGTLRKPLSFGRVTGSGAQKKKEGTELENLLDHKIAEEAADKKADEVRDEKTSMRGSESRTKGEALNSERAKTRAERKSTKVSVLCAKIKTGSEEAATLAARVKLLDGQDELVQAVQEAQKTVLAQLESSLLTSLSETEAAHATLQGEVSELVQKCQGMETDGLVWIGRLQGLLNPVLNEDVPTSPRIVDLGAIKAELETTLKDVVKKSLAALDEKKSLITKVDELCEELGRLEIGIGEQSEELSMKLANATSQLQISERSWSEKHSALDARLSESRLGWDVSESECRELESLRNILQNDFVTVRKNFGDLEKSKATVDLELDKIRAEYDGLSTSKSQADAELISLTNEHGRLQRIRSKVDQKLQEVQTRLDNTVSCLEQAKRENDRNSEKCRRLEDHRMKEVDQFHFDVKGVLGLPGYDCRHVLSLFGLDGPKLELGDGSCLPSNVWSSTVIMGKCPQSLETGGGMLRSMAVLIYSLECGETVDPWMIFNLWFTWETGFQEDTVNRGDLFGFLYRLGKMIMVCADEVSESVLWVSCQMLCSLVRYISPSSRGEVILGPEWANDVVGERALVFWSQVERAVEDRDSTPYTRLLELAWNRNLSSFDVAGFQCVEGDRKMDIGAAFFGQSLFMAIREEDGGSYILVFDREKVSFWSSAVGLWLRIEGHPKGGTKDWKVTRHVKATRDWLCRYHIEQRSGW